MLKGCVRPLITLVLVLVATSALATLSHARAPLGHEGTQLSRASSNPPGPGANSGEPDVPQAPPPVRLNGGMPTPTGDADAGADYWDIVWSISRVWVYWFAKASL